MKCNYVYIYLCMDVWLSVDTLELTRLSGDDASSGVGQCDRGLTYQIRNYLLGRLSGVRIANYPVLCIGVVLFVTRAQRCSCLNGSHLYECRRESETTRDSPLQHTTRPQPFTLNQNPSHHKKYTAAPKKRLRNVLMTMTTTMLTTMMVTMLATMMIKMVTPMMMTTLMVQTLTDNHHENNDSGDDNDNDSDGANNRDNDDDNNEKMRTLLPTTLPPSS